MGLSILNIGGHPKDVILYAGGTMAIHTSLGDRVCALTPTHGLSHHGRALDKFNQGKTIDLSALIEERKQELNEAANELGVTDIRFLGHSDEIVLPREEIIEEIADVICDVKPDIMITHWPDDSVAAHSNATRMALLAIETAACLRPSKPYTPHGVKQVFFHVQEGRTNVLENTRPQNPTTVIDITDTIHKKYKAMNKFKSQFYGEDSPLQRKLSESLDGSVHAIHARVPYAEAFVAMNPEVYRSLPMSEYGAELSKKNQSEELSHMSQMLLN